MNKQATCLKCGNMDRFVAVLEGLGYMEAQRELFALLERSECQTERAVTAAGLWKARAEKAEAEVLRLREGIVIRDRYRKMRSTWGDIECVYCGQTHCPDCCPTVTHPAEGPNE